MPILRGTDGEKKMGKSVGNYIGLNEPAKEMFGKTMRIPDTLMQEWFTLLTDRADKEIDEIVARQSERGEEASRHGNRHVLPRRRRCSGDARRLEQTVRRRRQADPDNIDEVTIPAAKLKDGAMLAVDLIAETKLLRARAKRAARSRKARSTTDQTEQRPPM